MDFGLPGGFGGGGNSPFGRAQGHVNDYHAMKSTSGGSGFSGGGSWNNKYNNNKNKKTNSDKLTKEEYNRRKRILEQNIRTYQIATAIIWCFDLILMMACSDSGWWIAILLGVGIIFTWAFVGEIKKCSNQLSLLELLYRTQESQKDKTDSEIHNNK